MKQKGNNLAAASGKYRTPLAQFPARLDAVRGAVAFVADALRLHGVAPQAVARAELVLEELFRNSVLHGYGGDSEHAVWVGVAGCVLHFQDAAPPFDPLTQGPPAPDPGAPIEDRRVGGVGLLLIRQLGSAIQYDYAEGRNRIIFSI